LTKPRRQRRKATFLWKSGTHQQAHTASQRWRHLTSSPPW